MYNIKLNNFEGPLDLLLFFIKRDELDIYDIPIANITNEFLEYVKVMELLDLELAGEFVVMASGLIQIKAQMLLPRQETGQGAVAGEIDENDPRYELVQKLLEYKRYKEASEELQVQAEHQKYTLYRQIFDADEIYASDNDSYRNATLFDLLKALRRAIQRAPEPTDPHTVTRYPITVEEKAAEILRVLSINSSARFFELVNQLSVQHIVVTFLAILELTKNAKIIVKQDVEFDDIVIEHAPAIAESH
jgi:segregation and condensation protein A